jgi:HAD superfamily hydrolase (TIGR01509 family)
MSAVLRPGVLFDVDGTLVDTNYLHTLAWARALREVGEWAPMNTIHRLVGMGGDQLVPRLLGREVPEANEARGRQYSELIEEARVFPGSAALLRKVHESSLAVVLATSSPEKEISFLRDLIDADDVIDAQTTADDVACSKPAPDVFLTAMETAGLDPRRSVAVGDTRWDVEAASAAGIGCVAVESGGFSRQELDEAGALRTYRDVEALLDDFDEGPLARLSM